MAAQDYTSVVQQLYVSYFGRPADYYGLQNFSNALAALDTKGELKTFAAVQAAMQADKTGTTGLTKLVNSFNNSAESNALYGTDNTQIGIGKFVNAIYQNVLGRDADLDGFNFWVNAITSGALTKANAAAAITQGALDNKSTQGLLDAQTVSNKLAVATSFTNMIDTPAEITSYAGDAAAAAARSLLSGVTSSTSVTAYQTNVADALNAIGGISTPSQTFTLTTGADILTGTGGNDKFIANVSVVTDPATGHQSNVETIQNVDRIDGGAGIDTFAFVTNGGTVTLPAMSNVEIVSAESLAGITIDTTAIAGVTTLNVTKAAGAVAATAAAGTDITVALKENGAATALTNNVNGGKNVTVNATDLGATANADAIVVGGTTAAKGNVVVNASGVKYDASADVTMGDITVTGGKTITVTQKATSDAAAAGAAGTNFTVTQGAINANANADTTAIVIKQDADADAEDAGFTTGGKTETASVKFGALKTGEAVTAAGLTLTAKADMSAAEVAAAFANLVKTSAGTFGSGDTQSGAVFAKGTYSGISSGWTSGAANGDTVVFTSNTTNSNVTDLAVTGTAVAATAAPVVTTTQGNAKNAGAADGAVGVAAGTVTIANGAALKTVSVDGYSVTGSTITGSNTLLDTLNLSNGGDFSVSNAAASLALTLNGVDGTFTQTAGAATLNVKSVGDNTANLVASTATALNVSGSGKLTATTSTLGSVKTIVVTETAGLNLGTSALTSLTSVDASATTGNVTLALDATAASYLGGKGTDIVTMTNTTASAKGIDLGDGNDTLVFAATTSAVPTGSIKGGAGTDTISLSGASAVSFSGTNTFVSKLDGFERLTINDSVATATTVNMDNMGFNYVTTSGTTSATLTLDKFVADGTVVLTAAGTVAVALKDATGSADNLNVIARVSTTSIDHGTLTANSIETIKLSTLDAAPVDSSTGLASIQTTTLSLAADSLTTLTIDGNANETLFLGSTTTKLATINASALTGKLTLDLTAQNGVAVSVTGGSASDVLKASIGVNAHADVLVGGAGNDSLYAGSNGATLTGGAGNDLFVLSATSLTTGSKEANTYSIVTDFSAGDLLKLNFFNTALTTPAEANVASFAKLTATLNPATSSFSNFVNAAMEQAHAGDAVWFSFNGNSYVVVDSGVDAATFTNGEDTIVQLTGVDLTNASYNITSGTIALV